MARVFYPQLCGKQATFFFPLYHSSRKFVSSPPYNAANESLMKKNQQRDFLEFISSPEYQTPFSFTLLAITPLVSPYLPLSPSLLLLASHISCLPLSSSTPSPLLLLFSSTLPPPPPPSFYSFSLLLALTPPSSLLSTPPPSFLLPSFYSFLSPSFLFLSPSLLFSSLLSLSLLSLPPTVAFPISQCRPPPPPQPQYQYRQEQEWTRG